MTKPAGPGGQFSEYARKSLHVAMGGFALLLRWLPWPAALALAVGAFLFNLYALPAMGRGRLFRAEEARKSGRDIGILIYPAVIALLILIFRERLDIVAAAWGALAFGDGFATIAGKAVGGPKLPWNRGKSWAGLIAFLVFGTAAAWFLFTWCDPGARGSADLPDSAWAEAGLGGMLALTWQRWGMHLVGAVGAAAIVETLPLGLDDNLSVPLVTAGTLQALLLVDPISWEAAHPQVYGRFWVAIAVNLVFGVLAYAARAVTIPGLIAGAVPGTIIYAGGGLPAFLVMLGFVFLGTAATKMGYARKAAAGIAQEKGGRRGPKNAFANCGTAAVLAILAVTTPYGPWMLLGLVAAFATAAADTVSSEFGQAYGRTTYLITTFRRVPRGTEGAVSLEGTLAGVAASAVLAGIAWGGGLCAGTGFLVVIVAAFIGTTAESYLGATLEQMKLIDNEAINFANTLIGALSAIGLAALAGA